MVEVEITAFQLDPPRARLKVRFFLVRKTEAHPGEFSKLLGMEKNGTSETEVATSLEKKIGLPEKTHWISKSDFCVCGGFLFLHQYLKKMELSMFEVCFFLIISAVCFLEGD